MTTALKMLGASVLAVGVLAAGLESIGDPTMYHDHGWAFYVFGADALLATLVVMRALLQGRTNADVRARMDRIQALVTEVDEKVARLQGVADERGPRIGRIAEAGNVLRERTMVLRDCDEEHEKRIARVEDKLQIARERAVARLALRGMVFDEAPLKDLLEEGAK